MSFVHELRVRYGECDPQGIVFNANYLLYFDVAFTEYWRARVGPWQEMVQGGTDAVVAEANLRFRSPARFDDMLALEVTTEELGRTSTTTRGYPPPPRRSAALASPARTPASTSATTVASATSGVTPVTARRSSPCAPA